MKYKTNPDEDFCKEVRAAIKANNGYCPCKFEHTKDTKCPCKNFRVETPDGYCECGLYYKEKEEE